MHTPQKLQDNSTPGAIAANALIAAVSLFLNGFGVYLTIQANIGAGPWDVLNLGLARTLGILYGTASISVSFTILLIDVLLREPIGIAMFIDAVVVGKAVDFFKRLGVVAPCAAASRARGTVLAVAPMIFSSPRILRAAATVISSAPRCTPSASTARATSTRSSTISGTR